AFWRKAKRHFNTKTVPIEDFLANNNIVSTPVDICEMARTYYEEQFPRHHQTQSEIETEANLVDFKLEETLKKKPPITIIITYHQLRRAITSLKNKNSTDLDGVSNR
ncbi:unnamed protein product, partial [Rotaria magnacalcarata]